LNELESISPEEVFRKLGIKYDRRGDKLYSLCPFHQEKTPSFSFSLTRKQGYCFGCGEGVNLWSLVKKLTGQSLLKFLGIKNYSSSYLAYKSSLEKFTTKKEGATNKIIEESTKDKFEAFEIIAKQLHPFDDEESKNYCLSRNITKEDIGQHNIFYITDGYVGDTRYKKRLVIPISNNLGDIVAFEGRDVTRKEKKKCIKNYKSKVGSTIFDWDKLDYNKRIIWVEGILDLIQVKKALPNEQVSSFFGVQLTNKQKEIVDKFVESTLMFDRDEGGEKGINNISEFLTKVFHVARLLYGNDPNESSYDMIRKAFNERVISTKYFMEKYEILDENKSKGNFLDTLNKFKRG
jgi:DNA primase